MKISLHLDAYFDQGGDNANATHWYIDSYEDIGGERPRVILARGHQSGPLEALDAMRAAMEKMGACQIPPRPTEHMGRPVMMDPSGKSPGPGVARYVKQRMDSQRTAQMEIEI